MPVDAGLISPLGLSAEAVNFGKLMPDYAAQRLEEQKLAIDRQQAQTAHAKQQAALEAQAKTSNLWDIYWAHPTGENLAKIYANDPEHPAGVKAAAGTYGRTRPQFQEASRLYVQSRTDPKGTGQAMMDRLNARRDPNTGALPPEDEDDEEIAKDLLSGNQDRQIFAQGRMLKGAADLSGDPDGFIEEHDKIYKPETLHWEDGLAYATRDGQVRLVGQAKQRWRHNLDGTDTKLPQMTGVPVLDVEGPTLPTRPVPTDEPPGEETTAPDGTPRDPLAPLPEGTPPVNNSPRRVMGMTPRKRDGGDNTNAQVDAKLGVIARQTGFGLDTPLAATDIPTLYDAYTQTEQGIGARYNNGGNLIDSPWTRAQPGFTGVVRRKNAPPIAKFNTPANGRRAGIALMMKKYESGHRTVRDIIEGRPEGRGARSQQPRTATAEIMHPRSMQEAMNYPAGTKFVTPNDPRVRTKK